MPATTRPCSIWAGSPPITSSHPRQATAGSKLTSSRRSPPPSNARPRRCAAPRSCAKPCGAWSRSSIRPSTLIMAATPKKISDASKRHGGISMAAETGTLPTTARCVIIGGGIIGCSLAYHLARLGWTEILLLERAKLTSGSTHHAAGLVGQLRSSANITQLLKYSVELYERLERETGQATGWKRNGGGCPPRQPRPPNA